MERNGTNGTKSQNEEVVNEMERNGTKSQNEEVVNETEDGKSQDVS